MRVLTILSVSKESGSYLKCGVAGEHFKTSHFVSDPRFDPMGLNLPESA